MANWQQSTADQWRLVIAGRVVARVWRGLAAYVWDTVAGDGTAPTIQAAKRRAQKALKEAA